MYIHQILKENGSARTARSNVLTILYNFSFWSKIDEELMTLISYSQSLHIAVSIRDNNAHYIAFT